MRRIQFSLSSMLFTTVFIGLMMLTLVAEHHEFGGKDCGMPLTWYCDNPISVAGGIHIFYERGIFVKRSSLFGQPIEMSYDNVDHRNRIVLVFDVAFWLAITSVTSIVFERLMQRDERKSMARRAAGY